MKLDTNNEGERADLKSTRTYPATTARTGVVSGRRWPVPCSGAAEGLWAALHEENHLIEVGSYPSCKRPEYKVLESYSDDEPPVMSMSRVE